MDNRLTVHRGGMPIYDIVLSDSFEGLAGEVKQLDVSGRRLCIVTDSVVAPLYLEEVRRILEQCCRKVTAFVFEAGEEHKNLDTVRNLYEFLIQQHFDRRDMLAALGGGVTSSRNLLYPDTNHPFIPGGQLHRRQNRRGF